MKNIDTEIRVVPGATLPFIDFVNLGRRLWVVFVVFTTYGKTFFFVLVFSSRTTGKTILQKGKFHKLIKAISIGNADDRDIDGNHHF